MRAVVTDEIETAGISISKEPSRKMVGRRARRLERNRQNLPYLDKPAQPVANPRTDQIYTIKKGTCALRANAIFYLRLYPFPIS